jgi:DNA-3-methyladenine glycosylase
MEIEGVHNGADLTDGPLRILPRTSPAPEIVATPRIGVTRAADRLWRYCVVGSAYVSRKA